MQGTIIQDLMLVNQTSLETQMVELADALQAGERKLLTQSTSKS